MRSMIIPARCLGAFIIVWNVSNIIAQLCLCQPFARNWDQTLDGHCGSRKFLSCFTPPPEGIHG